MQSCHMRSQIREVVPEDYGWYLANNFTYRSDIWQKNQNYVDCDCFSTASIPCSKVLKVWRKPVYPLKQKLDGIPQDYLTKMDTLSNVLSATCGQNRGLGALIIVSVLLFIAIMIVILRIYIRAYVLHNTGYDDYLVLIGLVSNFLSLSINRDTIVVGHTL